MVKKIPTNGLPAVVEFGDGSVIEVDSLTLEQKEKLDEIDKAYSMAREDAEIEYHKTLARIGRDYYREKNNLLAQWRQERE